MKIEFKTLKFKNIVSYGNKLQVYNFNNGIDLITAENGKGKSSIWTALYYALFGKSDKNIKIKNLINNINGKELYVELTFIIHHKTAIEYRIERGMYPHIFNIYKNNTLIEKLPSTKEYQLFLEDNILKITPNIFKQLISITANHNSFKPFTELNQTEREELLQMIIDTHIFNYILQEAKIRLQAKITDSTEVKYKIDTLTNTYNVEVNNIRKLEKMKKELENQNKEQLSAINEEKDLILERLNKINILLDKLNDKLKPFSLIKNEILKITNELKDIKNKIQNVDNLLYKIKTTKEQFKLCGTCSIVKQISGINIDDENKLKLELDELNLIKKELMEKIAELKEKIEKFKSINYKKENYESEKYILENKLKKIDSIIISDKFKEINIDYSNIKQIENEISELRKKDNELFNIITYYNNIIARFKDRSFKGDIIKQSLPLLNKFINEYLELFGADFGMVLEHNFNIKIFNTKNEIQLNQLSNGEKFRLNFSILFGMLKYLEYKSNISINLLVLDEILDSSLDIIGRNKLIEVLKYQIKDKNIIIITHNTDIKSMSNIFNRIIEIKKDKFSSINVI